MTTMTKEAPIKVTSTRYSCTSHADDWTNAASLFSISKVCKGEGFMPLARQLSMGIRIIYVRRTSVKELERKK